MTHTEIIFSMFIYSLFLVGVALCDLLLNSVGVALPIPFRLGDDISHECLSYLWGSPKAATIIYLKGISRGLLSLPTNLDLALRSVQQDGVDRLIWIDAICINQHDLEERNSS
jgi:hypothetical protein